VRGIFLWLVLLGLSLVAWGEEKRNWFDDPFAQATSGLAGCPVPAPPALSEQEVRDTAHKRAQAGTSCYLSGRCRLPNSYQYDKEIVPRVVRFLQNDGRFADTSVWVLGERRIVYVMGCVRTKEQAAAVEQAAGHVDDVMGVVNLLGVGTREPPRYETAK
jgi:hypothetical protein